MEDNNKKGKKSVLDISVVLSFAVAIFAIFSLVMADLSLSQRSNISYAAPPDDNTFTFYKGDALVASSPGNPSFSSMMYFANNDSNIPVFCIEYANTNIENAAEYTADGDIDDYGLLYLLNNSYANGIEIVNASTSGVVNNSAENARYVNSWITQAAIWAYLYEKAGAANVGTTSPDYISEEDYNGLKFATTITRTAYSGGVITQNNIPVYEGPNLYDNYVSGLVTAALSASNPISLNVNLESTEISTDANKNYYFSAPITVTGEPANSIQNYTISATGIEGAVLVYEDGSEVTGTITYPGAPFRVRIPAEKITKEIQKVVVTVNGNFNTLNGRYYTSGSRQKVVTVKAGTTTVSKGTEVEFYGAPDTGMSTAQTIYFIGLIVLLCGVGIVYANAKPVQVKQ